MSNKIVTHRSAKTGHFVTERYAKAHPSTTVREVNKPSRNTSPNKRKR